MNRLLILMILLLPLASVNRLQGKNKTFVLVLDPGHGGSDPGAVSEDKKSKEKDINLAVALLAGDMIEKQHPDVKVVYTRKNDMTMSLPKRAQIANNAKADLFISIHANAAKNRSAHGAEVFVFDKSKSNENLEVIQRENQILYLEDEFKDLSIADFLNPVETSIIFEAMQQVFHEHSYDIAKLIQDELVTRARREDRGVRSGNFAVLRRSGMPGVLIELDFISCNEAKNYMISKQGQKTMAQCISNAFAEYKRKFDLRTQGLQNENKAEPTVVSNKTSSPKRGQVYKVQIYSSASPLTSSQLKGYQADYYVENGLYKYTIGETGDWDEIQRIRKSVLKDFGDAFIVKFENGERVRN